MTMSALPDFNSLETLAATDIGRVRAENQDCCAVTRIPDGVLLVVCDGMGGHEGGAVASRVAMATLHSELHAQPTKDRAADLERAILAAGQAVRSEARTQTRLRTMGTTCVAALVTPEGVAYIGNVGDSRAYILSGASTVQLTRDHTVYEDQLRSGVRFMAETSEALRHVLTRCLGMEAGLRVDMFELKLEPEDVLLLCSDGLLAHVDDEEIAEAFLGVDLATGTRLLIDTANARGGSDNISIAALHWPRRVPNVAPRAHKHST
jgi:protein phosphatase